MEESRRARASVSLSSVSPFTRSFKSSPTAAIKRFFSSEFTCVWNLSCLSAYSFSLRMSLYMSSQSDVPVCCSVTLPEDRFKLCTLAVSWLARTFTSMLFLLRDTLLLKDDIDGLLVCFFGVVGRRGVTAALYGSNGTNRGSLVLLNVEPEEDAEGLPTSFGTKL